MSGPDPLFLVWVVASVSWNSFLNSNSTLCYKLESVFSIYFISCLHSLFSDTMNKVRPMKFICRGLEPLPTLPKFYLSSFLVFPGCVSFWWHFGHIMNTLFTTEEKLETHTVVLYCSVFQSFPKFVLAK